MKCRWCDESETGMCYAHWSQRQEMRAHITRDLRAVAIMIACTVIGWAAYWWLQ